MKNRDRKFDLSEIEHDRDTLINELKELEENARQLDIAIKMQRGAIHYANHFIERKRAEIAKAENTENTETAENGPTTLETTAADTNGAGQPANAESGGDFAPSDANAHLDEAVGSEMAEAIRTALENGDVIVDGFDPEGQ